MWSPCFQLIIKRPAMPGDEDRQPQQDQVGWRPAFWRCRGTAPNQRAPAPARPSSRPGRRSAEPPSSRRSLPAAPRHPKPEIQRRQEIHYAPRRRSRRNWIAAPALTRRHAGTTGDRLCSQASAAACQKPAAGHCSSSLRPPGPMTKSCRMPVPGMPPTV